MPNQIVSLKNFDYIVGVDQTGATIKGKPKKLAFSYFETQKNTLNLGLNLKSFKLSEFSKFINDFNNKRVLIVVDAVLGFPFSVKISIFDVLREIKSFEGHGLSKGQEFFDYLKKKYIIKNNPLRKIEKILGANSVFTPYPFQKNVQTGTYRILKDLSHDEKWYNILPYEKQNFNKYLIEGYPSKAFKELVGTQRSIENFYYFLATLDIKTTFYRSLTLDHIDSAMLVLQALAQKDLEIKIHKKSEGFIL